MSANPGELRHHGYVTAGDFPISAALDPQGRFVYLANRLSDGVSAYTIDPATGTLTAITGAPFTAADGPLSVTVDPTVS